MGRATVAADRRKIQTNLSRGGQWGTEKDPIGGREWLERGGEEPRDCVRGLEKRDGDFEREGGCRRFGGCGPRIIEGGEKQICMRGGPGPSIVGGSGGLPEQSRKKNEGKLQAQISESPDLEIAERGKTWKLVRVRGKTYLMWESREESLGEG